MLLIVRLVDLYLGGLDLSPMVLLILLQVLRNVLL
jgi:uncharacterized protein YggT (Ycf19 family)